MVLSVPAMPKDRYYSAEVNDLYTFIAGYLGTRAMGNEAGNYLIAGPNWKGERPPGIKSDHPGRDATRVRLLPHPTLPAG